MTSVADSGKGAAFVTLLTGNRYAGPAACLPHQLRAVHSTLSIFLVFDDSDSTLPVKLLEREYGAAQMVPLTRLRQRYTAVFGSSLATQPQRPTGFAESRRRLYETEERAGTWLKLWIWALPETRQFIFIDVDSLILQNVDELAEVEVPPAGLGAVACGGRFFNSGLMVFRPSLRRLYELLYYRRFVDYPWNGHVPWMYRGRAPGWVDTCSPLADPLAAVHMLARFKHLRHLNATQALRVCQKRHARNAREPALIVKACEPKLTDQSLLNHAFRSSHSLIPRHLAGSKVFDSSRRVIHFVGEPKPWSPVWSRRGETRGRRNASLLWRSRCATIMTRLGAPLVR